MAFDCGWVQMDGEREVSLMSRGNGINKGTEAGLSVALAVQQFSPLGLEFQSLSRSALTTPAPLPATPSHRMPFPSRQPLHPSGLHSSDACVLTYSKPSPGCVARCPLQPSAVLHPEQRPSSSLSPLVQIIRPCIPLPVIYPGAWTRAGVRKYFQN